MKDLNPVFALVSAVGVVVIIMTTNQANLNKRLEAIQAENSRRFDAMQAENNRRFDAIDRRFDRVEERFDQLFEVLRFFESRITRLEERAGIGTDNQ